MCNFDIYKDIALRTNGDIYLGVVGPVRTGKSTLIGKILNMLVLPNINEKNLKERAIDEMPQSADGKTIMTTQPRFIPNEAVGVRIQDNVDLNIRLIDCVGYFVEGAIGNVENDKPRLVKTPWSDEEIPFEKAAEIGTQKVIANHSTIGLMVTTDGSVSGIPRENYVSAEEKTIAELKKSGKPYVLILNSTHPESPETINLRAQLEKKYNVSCLALNVQELTHEELSKIFEVVLLEFPIRKLDVKMPEWLKALPYTSEIIINVIERIKSFIDSISKIGNIEKDMVMFDEHDDFEKNVNVSVSMGEGSVCLEIVPKPQLFYKVLSEQSGEDIVDDYCLVSYIKQMSVAKRYYEKFKDALEQVEETGYGIVHPTLDEMTLEEPKIIKQGGKFGVKLQASAPSLHIMQVDLKTEVNSLVGSEQQSEELVNYLMSEFENNPNSIWETKMFGTSLNHLVNEGLHNKLVAVPSDAMKKMRKTLGRIVNEGKGGVICILL